MCDRTALSSCRSVPDENFWRTRRVSYRASSSAGNSGRFFSWSSGAPITITASNAELTWTQAPQTINLTRTPNTPHILGAFPKDIGKLTYTSNGGYYFSGYKQVTDPSVSNITPLQTLQNSFSNKALADANGN